MLDGLKGRGLLERAVVVRSGESSVQLAPAAPAAPRTDHEADIKRQDEEVEDLMYAAARG